MRRKLPFDAENLELVRRAMREVAMRGTGRRLFTRTETDPDAPPGAKPRRHVLDVDCAGKTGTAEIGRGATRRKNTWIIAFAPYDQPTLAVAMIVERGESGGATVAPKVHNLLAAAFGEHEEAEGRP